MRVAVYPADDGGCGHYRLIWPATALADQGADVDVHHPDDGGIRGMFVDDPDPRMVDVEAPEADVVVLQRPLRWEVADAVPRLQAKGLRVVVEVDDDFAAIHPHNVSWRACHPTHSPGRNWRHLARACAQADLVIVSTPALARRYGSHGRVVVVPNCVPARYLDIAAEAHDGLFVGWSGSVDTHPTDLQVTRGAVARAIDGLATMAVVGTGRGVQRGLSLTSEPLASGWLPIERYPEALANFDVGIVPLDLIAFNEAKSHLKGLEFAAVGVPFVASPTGPYANLVAQGAGLVADKPKAWARHLRRLLTDDDHRAELAAAGRAVAARHTIEGNADRWWDAWTSCLDQRRAA